ncbi:MAG: hypothetical protein ACXU8U_01455 [Asticcacaulis sp.]
MSDLSRGLTDLDHAPVAAPPTAMIVPDAKPDDALRSEGELPESPPPSDVPEVNPGAFPENNPDLQPEIPPVETPDI